MTHAFELIMNYLLNALWQVSLLFVVAWLLSHALRRLGPLAEHRLWVTTLLAQFVLPACSAPGLAAAISRLFHHREQADGIVTVTLGAATPIAFGGVAPATLQIAMLLYAALTVFFIARFVRQCVHLNKLTAEAQPVLLSPEDTVFWHSALAQFQLRDVRLATAPIVRAPITFGIRHPMLLLPTEFVGKTTRDQLHAALSHELAHIRRRDYAKQLLYRVLSLPIAWHPLLWPTLARVVATREEVCDRVAAEQTGSARKYATSLLQLASLLAQARPTHAHAIGIFDANQLERRILMLHQNQPILSRARRVGLLAAVATAALTTGTSALALHLDMDPPPVTATTAAEGQSVKVPSGVMAAQSASKVQPKYPAEAKKAKIQGAVVLDATIGKDGTIENLTVVSGPEELRASSIDAVRQWTYKPYLLNGQPTEVQTTITVTYSFSPDTPSPPHSESQSSTLSSEKPQGTVPPRLLSQVVADYPADAKRKKIGGEVIVSAKIAVDGKVNDADALSGPPELRAAATDAVRQYVFAPATMNGQPVPVDLHIAVKFEVF